MNHRYNSSDMLEFEEWTRQVFNKIFKLEEDWLRANLFKYGIPEDAHAATRCKIVKQDKAHIWDSILYIDGKIVSVLRINSVTLEATIENQDGFSSKSILNVYS